MNNQKILSSAKILFKHKLNKTGLNSLKELEPQNINDAYKIQNELKVEYLSLTNNICIGKKNWLHFRCCTRANEYHRAILWKFI